MIAANVHMIAANVQVFVNDMRPGYGRYLMQRRLNEIPRVGDEIVLMPRSMFPTDADERNAGATPASYGDDPTTQVRRVVWHDNLVRVYCQDLFFHAEIEEVITALLASGWS